MTRRWRGGDLIKLFSPKDVYRCSSFFFLALCARSLALASLASSPMFLKRTKRKMTIGNWNVRTLYRSGNIAQLTREITSRKIDIVGISETHWIGKVKVQLENGEAIIYHREETTTITGEWVYWWQEVQQEPWWTGLWSVKGTFRQGSIPNVYFLILFNVFFQKVEGGGGEVWSPSPSPCAGSDIRISTRQLGYRRIG